MNHSTPDHFWRPDAANHARRTEKCSRSILSPLILRLYRVHRLRSLSLKLCHRLEGGPFFSQTLRQILRSYHGVEIGHYSYGSILRPGLLPRGSRIGAYCSVGAELIVRRRDHPVDRAVMHPFFFNHVLGLVAQDTIPTEEENPLEIGNDVWIGDRVTILGGCRRIGNGAVLAAGTVVTRDVDPYCIVGGIPARPIRIRFSPERIARLEASRWWERPVSELIENDPDRL